MEDILVVSRPPKPVKVLVQLTITVPDSLSAREIRAPIEEALRGLWPIAQTKVWYAGRYKDETSPI